MPKSLPPFVLQLITGLLRHGLTALAGVIVAHGYLTADQSQQGVGAVLVLIGLGWSAYTTTTNHATVAAIQAGTVTTVVHTPSQTADGGHTTVTTTTPGANVNDPDPS